ncbi:MAG TPA: C40 family peptidase [Chloroflexota bacterium]|nr:C40 family peptidase [Chloroflexota bacterium]
MARGVVDVWARPARGADDDRLTQALLGQAATVLETRGEWARVRLPDYEGWVERACLASPAAAATAEALAVTALAAPLYAGPEGDVARDEAYLGTALPLLGRDGARWRVALPGGQPAWLARDAGEARPRGAAYPPRPAAHAVAVARQLLGSPYLWGGGTVRGIDCSALVQLAYAVSGHTLPRDADQQWAALPIPVARDALVAGDLLFFARDGAIVHVALALGGAAYLHALGEPPRGVCIQSLAPGAPNYNARLDALYLGARRVVPA